jgi:hypothetical protein
MRMVMTRGRATVGEIVQQAQRAEAMGSVTFDGFSDLWYASGVTGIRWRPGQ